MALPRLAAAVEDASVRLWLPVTVRVAWELLLARVRVRPAVLAEAREHVMRSLPSNATPEEAEDLAGVYVADYLARVQHQRYQRPVLDPDLRLTLPRVWRERLADSLDPVADAVLRMHYGDGLSMDEVERHAAVDSGILEGAREGVRETMRQIAEADGVSLEAWTDERVDRLLRRVSTLAGTNCPGPAGLLSPVGRDHAGRCPRCSRAVRLIRQGVIAPTDLFPPQGDAGDLSARTKVLALVLHPDARKQRAGVSRALGDGALAVGEDVWLISADEIPAITPELVRLAEEGTPPRHHLRGAVVEGPGRWRRGVLLGPAPLAALEEARSRPWAEIDGVGELPLPLPPPPSSVGWWMIAGLATTAAALAGWWVLTPPEVAPAWPIDGAWTRTDAGLEVRFDTDDLAVLDVVVQDDSGVHLDQGGLRAEKGRLATGEGDFALNLPAARALLISSPDGLSDLDALIAGARVQADPMAALARLVTEQHPTAFVFASPGPDPAP